MNIVIKPEAINQLRGREFQENEGIRIEATFVGSCTIYAEHSLLVDIKQDDDDIFMVEDIPVVISKKSQKYLDENIFLDYSPQLGYKISSDQETYKYNLQLKENK
ncbi:iron-sulfur cluster biosynthesis family protein [Metabacillus litoralis]|uniref:Iron-sulfur cluster biosynthesis family protein n=1 Tax=Metabacillus litoralis TaxID=152268 RepID=A0A5C6W0H1_9BACI|nr:iron-sulfur cluster biosynthesis family protein [Metabacillus litoralis]TXC90459.1 iron-sulfur cluster biosynthesis family protein [Metabacillus litoralis]